MNHKTYIKTIIFSTSFLLMLVIDLLLGNTAEVFNLYYFILSLFGLTENKFIIFQDELGVFSYAAAFIVAITIHYSVAVIFYNQLIKRRNNENA